MGISPRQWGILRQRAGWLLEGALTAALLLVAGLVVGRAILLIWEALASSAR